MKCNICGKRIKWWQHCQMIAGFGKHKDGIWIHRKCKLG